MSWIKRGKKVTGDRAIEFIERARHRPDLTSIVFSTNYYELEDGRIVEAFVQIAEPDSGGHWDEEFPAVSIWSVYTSEQAMDELRGKTMQRLEEEGWVRPPERGPERLDIILGAEEAEMFFGTHHELDPSFYQSFISSCQSSYFQNRRGNIFHVFRSPAQPPSAEHPQGLPADYSIRITARFDSHEHAVQWAAYVKGSSGRHLLWKYTRNRPDWKAELPLWLDFLTKHLSVARDALDFSLLSCKLLDKARKRAKVSRATFHKSYFAPMLGYTCETISRAISGTWEMRPASTDAEVWEPWIIRQDGQAFQLYTDFWDWAHEDYRNFSLAGLVQMATPDD